MFLHIYEPLYIPLKGHIVCSGLVMPKYLFINRLHQKHAGIYQKYTIQTSLHLRATETDSLAVEPWDFPGGPVVKNLPCNAGDVGSIPGQGTKIPHDTKQLSLCTTMKTQHSSVPTTTKKNTLLGNVDSITFIFTQ